MKETVGHRFTIAKADYLMIRTTPQLHLVDIQALGKYDDLRSTRYLVTGTIVTGHDGRRWAQLRSETDWGLG